MLECRSRRGLANRALFSETSEITLLARLARSNAFANALSAFLAFWLKWEGAAGRTFLLV